MSRSFKKLKGFVFDLDGTLVDSKLDFDLMRKELGFPRDVPILEHLELLKSEDEIEKANQIIESHERKGAEISTIYPGVIDLITFLKNKNFKLGLLTRNNKRVTEMTLNKFNLSFDEVFSREDCLPKPDPSGLLIMADRWKISSKEMIYIGDFKFDIETAHRAGALAGYFSSNSNPNKELIKLSDVHISCYLEFKLYLSSIL